jgi:hypothetical protein
MRKSLFLYLFVFAVVINLFTYMWFKGQHEKDEKRIVNIQKQLKTSRDSITQAALKGESDAHFSLENNISAKADMGMSNVDKLVIQIRDDLYEKNVGDKGNPLVGYPPLGDRPFVIDKIKVLNNRWIIADFSDGTHEGEVLLKYFVEDDGSVTYETMQTLLHTSVN